MGLTPNYKQSDVGPIPEDWDVLPLGTLVRSVEYGSAAKSDAKGAVPVLRMGNLQGGKIDWSDLVYTDDIDEIQKYTLQPGDVLFNRTNTIDLVGKTSIYEGCYPAIFAGYLIRINVVPELLDSRFLNYVLNAEFSRKYSAKVLSVAVGQANINGQKLKTYPIPLPPTKTEQEVIAQALSDVDALLATLDQVIAKKRDLKQATMQQLLTGKTRLPGFSGDWDVVEFGDIATIRNEKVLCSSTPEGTPCVELEFIGQANGRLLGYIEATGASSKYSFKEGDVLFGRLRAYLRKHWRATFDAVCSTEIWPLIPRNERLYGGYLHLLVQMNSFVDAACVSYGTHMPRSDWTVLGKFEVHLPAVPEQAAISTSLSDMDAELETLEKRLEKTRQLKQAMMRELLTGKTRLVSGKI